MSFGQGHAELFRELRVAGGDGLEDRGVAVLDGGGDEVLDLARDARHRGADDEDAKALLLSPPHDPGYPLPCRKARHARPAEFDYDPRPACIFRHTVISLCHSEAEPKNHVPCVTQRP